MTPNWRLAARVRSQPPVEADKVNGRKADSLNAALNVASGELVLLDRCRHADRARRVAADGPPVPAR